MGGQIEPTGRDFAQGIPDLEDGAMLRGQYDGQAVIAIRRGHEYFVVAAACSHWGENLADGAVIGDTIRCAHHHACFSIRSGEALTPPALGPIQAFTVEPRGSGRVVTGPMKRAKPHEMSGGPKSVVIIGGGAAGSACALALRSEGYNGPVTMISADADLPCDRPNVSKDYLAGNAPEEWLFLRDAAGWEKAGIELRTRTRVTRIDRKARQVQLAGGDTLSYDALLLAPGTEATRLPIPGADLPHVHVLRTVDDARQIITKARDSVSAVVIGSSFIGMEAAASLKARGIDVHVVSPDTVPFARILGPQAGGVLHRAHVKNGVKFHLGRKPASILQRAVVLDDGSQIVAQLVVMGVGVRPSLSLAEEAGLTVDRGVIVDDQLRTSDPAIWAAGDVARYVDARTLQNVRFEHWVVALCQGLLAALALVGRSVKLHQVPFFWTTQFGLSLRYVGHAESWDRIDVDGDPDSTNCAFAYRRAGKTLALAFYGRDRDALIAGDALARGDEAALAAIVPG
jgi:NADPH-dependent 2,4-dienoyl-CoA reductase/sulfur reductase-like enzyme/nitrite reductase/ring-hydroxylating ferredoxin subunit